MIAWTGKCAAAAMLAAGAATFLTIILIGGAPAPSPETPLGSLAACRVYGGIPRGWPDQPVAGMRRVKIGDGILWVDRTEVTNAQFSAFVEATGYRTLAERRGSSEVFVGSQDAWPASDAPATWWQLRGGTSWRYPAGPQDTIAKPNHPVVHIARADAAAYAEWLGNRLPTEQEWELLVGGADAARTVPSRAPPKDAAGRPLANFWQGVFPLHDSADDGFSGTAPVGCFPPGGGGLFDGIANVWEWTASEVEPVTGAVGQVENLPDWPASSARLGVIRGGSYLCSENYCARYRVSARQPVDPETTAVHIGFRTVRDAHAL